MAMEGTAETNIHLRAQISDDPYAPYALDNKEPNQCRANKSKSASEAERFIGTIGAIGSVAKGEEFDAAGQRE
jgi:hypothetical protein